MGDLVNTVLLIIRVGLPFILIGLGIIILTIGSLEDLRWRFNIDTGQQFRIQLVGGVLILAGFAIVAFPLLRFDRSSESSTPEPTGLPAPFIRILEPSGTITCTGSTSACSFDVSGVAGGVAPPMDAYRVIAFVFPVEPPGAGYYLQKRQSILQEDGSWVLAPAYFGGSFRVESGQKLRIRSALVNRDATVNGTQLDQLPADFYLGRVEDVQGIIALSDIVELSVE